MPPTHWGTIMGSTNDDAHLAALTLAHLLPFAEI